MGHFAKTGLYRGIAVLVFLWIPELLLILCNPVLVFFRITVNLSSKLLTQYLIPINNPYSSACSSSSKVLANANLYTTYLGSEEFKEK